MMAVVLALFAFLCGLLGGTLVALKDFGLVDWSWVLVLIPFTLPSVALGSVLFVGAACVAIEEAVRLTWGAA